MSSLNKVQLIGRLGKDPEIRRLDSCVIVASFSIATSENYTNKQGEKVDIFRFNCGHWCTDTVFKDMIRVKTNQKVKNEKQLLIFN